ncbi:T9SS type A sorting domain-containing protein [Mangrovimonas yunxiaonensis]|nr:T9SS type A sorting domain-containing protein [Mangrovimonas yunxiaonensis]
MKKITFYFFALCCFAFSWQGMAQSVINITTNGGSYTGEKWVSITTEANGGGTQIWGQGNGTQCDGAGLINVDINIAPGVYYVNCYDQYDDGWDGTLISVTAFGSVIGDNGGVSPNDGEDTDAQSSCEGTPEELEASFMITVPNPPTCLPPSAMTDVVVTATTADLEWTAGASGETAWNLEWKAGADFTPGNGEADGTDSASGAPAYSAINLTPNTTYYVYYQADCGGGDTSTWAGAFVFTTECAAYTPDYTADMSTNAPDCWREATEGDIASGPAGFGSGLWYASSHNGTPSNAINIWSDYKSDWLISPIIDLSSAAPSELKVYVALTEGGTSGSGADLGSDDEVALLMTTDGGATWTTMQSWTQGNVPTDVGEEITYDLTAQTGQVQFAFWGSEGTVNDSEDVYFHVSTFVVREIPACSDVSDITIDGLTGTSVDFSWTQEDGSTTDWEYVVQTADLDAPTGSGTAVSGTPSAQDATLMADTFYEIYVRSYCGGSDYGAWIGPVEFYTGHCVPSGTSTLTYIDVFTTTGATGTNIDNSSSGLSIDNYGDYFDTHTVSLAADQSFDFNLEIISGSVGSAIWVDWNNDLQFDTSEVLFSTTSYGYGQTGTITVPSGTPNGDYRMRVLIDYSDSNPGDDDACSFTYGRGEAEDYKLTVDSSLSTDSFVLNEKLFTYYPNPVNNELNLKAQRNISNVSVYNMLGQEVVRTAPNAVISNVDMSALQAGAYFVKVTVDGTTETIRIIKK